MLHSCTAQTPSVSWQHSWRLLGCFSEPVCRTMRPNRYIPYSSIHPCLSQLFATNNWGTIGNNWEFLIHTGSSRGWSACDAHPIGYFIRNLFLAFRMLHAQWLKGPTKRQSLALDDVWSSDSNARHSNTTLDPGKYGVRAGHMQISVRRRSLRKSTLPRICRIRALGCCIR